MTTEIDSKTRLLDAAVKLFAQKTYDGTSVKDLATEADVNVSMVSYYFGGKEGLYRACIERVGKDRMAAAQRILQPARSAEEFRVRMRMLVEEMMNFHAEQGDVTTLVMREACMESTRAQDVFKSHFLSNFMLFSQFLSDGQKQGFLRTELDPQITGGLMYGMLLHFVRFERRNCGDFDVSISNPETRTKISNHIIETFLNGVMPR